MSDQKLTRSAPRWAPGAGWLHRADTLDDARRSSSDSTPVRCARRSSGSTPTRAAVSTRDFHRGENANDRYYSDARVKPNPSLGPIETPPFYAVEVYPSDLGTKAGLVTDAGGRVLDTRGAVIGGLYAAGNSASTVMGRSYPGAGGDDRAGHDASASWPPRRWPSTPAWRCRQLRP